MIRVAWLVVLFAASGSMADEGKSLKVFARGAWTELPTHGPAGIGTGGTSTFVIRDAAELAKAGGGGMTVTLPKLLGVEAIDWKKQMVVAVGDGTQPMVGISGGGPPSAPYALHVVRIERDAAGKQVTVFWRRLPRVEKEGILTRPLTAVLVERTEGEAKFVKLPDPAAKDRDEPAAAGKPVRVIARALFAEGWPPEAPPKEWVIRSEDEFLDRRLRAPEPVLERMRQEIKARYAKALGVEAIDFSKQMIVGVSAGVHPVGYSVSILGVEIDAGGTTATVSWRLKPGGAPADGVAHPAGVALIEAFAGPVKFQAKKLEE